MSHTIQMLIIQIDTTSLEFVSYHLFINKSLLLWSIITRLAIRPFGSYLRGLGALLAALCLSSETAKGTRFAQRFARHFAWHFARRFARCFSNRLLDSLFTIIFFQMMKVSRVQKLSLLSFVLHYIGLLEDIQR